MTVARDLYPFEGRFLDLDGVRMHYLDEGPADADTAVLLLHGNPAWSFYWRELVSVLRERHRVVVPDHVGCGLSDKPPASEYPYTLERRIADLDRLIEHLGLGSLRLGVHDWGGMIGLSWAVEHPEKIERLLVSNTAAFPLPTGRRIPPSLRLARTPGLGALLVRGLNLFSRGAVASCVTHPLSPAVRNAYLEPYDSWAHRIAVHRFVKDIPLAPGHPAWERVVRTSERLDLLREVPTLVTWGRRDFVFDDAFLDEWRRRLPEAQYEIFDDAGHWVLEDASDEIVPKVAELFESKEGA